MHPRWAREKPATRTPHQLGRDQPEKGPPPARGPGEGQPRGAEGVLTPVLTQPTATVPHGAGSRGAGRGPSGARDPAAETEGGAGRGGQPASSHPSDGRATFFFNVNINLPCGSAIPRLRICPGETRMCLHRDLDTNAHSSFLHHSEKTGTA